MKNKFKIKSYSALMIVFVLAGVILVNMITVTLSGKMPLKVDLTGEQIFSLTEETLEVLKRVDRDVYIYYFVTTGSENTSVEQTINMYKGHSDKLHFAHKDPAKEPVFTKSMGVEVSENSVVVKCGDRVRLIEYASMMDYTYQQYGITEFKLEQQITRALDYVISDEDINVLFTTGHTENGFEIMSAFLEGENAKVSEIDLKTADIPADTNALYIIGPQRDFSADEVLKVNEYLQAGGSLNLALDLSELTAELPILCQYMSEYWGVHFDDNIVTETDETGYLGNNPYFLIPRVSPHEITDGIIEKQLSIIWPYSRSIYTTEKPGVEVTELLASSSEAIAQSTAVSEEQQEAIAKKYVLAAALSYSNYSEKTVTKIIVSGTTLYNTGDYTGASSVANSDFVRAGLNYLNGGETSAISVTPKNVSMEQMNLTQEEISRYNALLCVLPPLLILAAGLAMWLRRRHL